MSDENELLEPPYYDMLIVRFRGDNYDMVLPYCEVANGDIVGVTDDAVEIEAKLKTGKGQDRAQLTYIEFVKVIEKSFDTKEIVKLYVQLAGSCEQIKLL